MKHLILLLMNQVIQKNILFLLIFQEIFPQLTQLLLYKLAVCLIIHKNCQKIMFKILFKSKKILKTKMFDLLCLFVLLITRISLQN